MLRLPTRPVTAGNYGSWGACNTRLGAGETVGCESFEQVQIGRRIEVYDEVFDPRRRECLEVDLVFFADCERRRLQDLVVVATDALAMVVQHGELVAVEPRIERVGEVARVRVLRDEPQQHLLSGSADEDRSFRAPRAKHPQRALEVRKSG